MNILLIVIAVLAGAGLLIQVILLLRQPPSVIDHLAPLLERLIRIEEGNQHLHEIRSDAREARDAARKVGDEMAETRGRISGFQDSQIKASECIASLQSDLPLKLAEGIRSITIALQETMTLQIVPELTLTKNHIVEETRKGDDRFRMYSEESRATFKSLEATIAQVQAHSHQLTIEQADRNYMGIDSRLTTSFLAMNDLLDQMRKADGLHRQEIGQASITTRDEITGVLRGMQQTVGDQMIHMREEAGQHRAEITQATNTMRAEVGGVLKTSGEAITNKMEELRVMTDQRMTDLKGAVDQALKAELGAIRTENSAKLEEMRLTVDEKLHATLEQRLGESFKQVSDRLEQVHRGLGEMQTLAAGVGDLKKVLTNVKTRGTWGEVQLGALLEQIMTPEQYAKNVPTIPGSAARVEFAIRLPGRVDNGAPVWLPIDAKFPLEDYQRMVEAQERADIPGIEEAGKALETRIKLEAKTIRDKYIDPPNTTDFAILYLPTEGIYAEVLRRPGLTDTLQRDFKINVAGPTTLAAMLNSLQMGFRTLAIEKRSSEVWTVLGEVKSEFMKFGKALEHTRKKLEEATTSIDTTERRNRVLTKKLSDVEVVGNQLPGIPLVGDQVALVLGVSTEVQPDIKEEASASEESA